MKRFIVFFGVLAGIGCAVYLLPWVGWKFSEIVKEPYERVLMIPFTNIGDTALEFIFGTMTIAMIIIMFLLIRDLWRWTGKFGVVLFVLLTLVACSGPNENESKYRLSYNEITNEYRIERKSGNDYVEYSITPNSYIVFDENPNGSLIFPGRSLVEKGDKSLKAWEMLLAELNKSAEADRKRSEEFDRIQKAWRTVK